MTTTVPTFQRPVSATERLYLATQPLAPPFAIQLVVTGTGDLDPDDLVAAVARASAACPGTRLVRRAGTWVDSGAPPHVEVVDSAEIDFTDLDASPVLRRQLGLSPQTTTEVVLLRGEATTVVFRAFHGVMDAKGLGTWAADVFRVLRGEDPIGAPDPTADHDLVARIGMRGKPTTLVPTRRSPLGVTGRAPRDARFTWRHRTVPGTTTGAVARISAVLADAVGRPTRIMVPVDLRRHDPTIRSTANLALPLFLDVAPGQSWSEVNAQLLVGLVEGRELNEMDNGGLAKLPAAVTRAILEAAHRLGAHADRNLVAAIVSHAGDVGPELLSAPGFTAASVRALPVHTGLVPMSFVILESGGNTEITVSCRAGDKVAGRLDELLDRVATALTVDHPAPALDLAPALPVETTATPTSDNADLRFRRHAELTPDAVAVIGPGGRHTYRELDRRADAIAAELRGHGAGPGSIVAILADRSVDGVAGQLGILRAGAAFLPLDPKHPADRLSAIVADSGARALLAARPHRDRITADVPVLVLEDLPEHTDHPVRERIRGDDVAFVTYTSGSTGQPKGVLVPHAGVVNFVDSATDWYLLGPQTRFAHHHTPAADMACAAFFGALLTGGAVTLVPGEISHVSLRSMVGDGVANTFLLTPSLLEVVVGLEIDPPNPRTVIIGGEQLRPGLAAAARRFFGPGARLHNSYGPTELSIVCTSHLIDPDPDPDATSVPIGTPATNTPVYLLDAQARAVPTGEIGELYFGGPQVAREYLGRPELTAQRFVVLPGGVRAYRTGDLARLLPSGVLDFVGRVDDQVKVRGNRVEPGEVQAVLDRFPGIGRSAVAGRRGPSGGNVLAAYLVADGGIDVDAVRSFLAERLPAYMIPAAIHVVDDLPLTGNGKLDLARLPGAVEAAGPRDAAPMPDDDADPDLGRITAIWAKVLEIGPQRLTPDSDFFALGGDSLSSLEMLSQVSRTVVGAAGEARFVAQLEGLVHHLTLARVHAAAVAARDAGAAS
ncbi:non-ribosomal peptide synthetase [Rhodococcus tukisamuensis]|uniref:Amino acid adenylation domain-containing protein n=1 Tax=Rhodococcus tukisamuensis TaxID=168276 RepID=A0A1G6Z3I7_9NOCA|nr:non-ribosomal peptide synthetase [Rhodococcus tukisamuensis]SDD97052.1 amino acid adenylation domain-containing protein [Rhodococcus tukisamuensis]